MKKLGKPSALAAAVALSLTLPSSPGALASPFVDDASGSLQLRNYYFNRDFRDTGARPQAEEWAQGFIFRGKSGYSHGDQGLGLDVHAALGLKLASDDDHAGTALLPNALGDEGPDSYSHITFTAKAKISETELKVGGLTPSVPVLQASDIRLLPQTYTGAALTMNEISGLALQAAQLREFNQLNSTNREDMIANIGGTSDRFNYFGGAYTFPAQSSDSTTLGLWRGDLDGVYDQNMINLLHNMTLGDWKVGANLAYFDSDIEAGSTDNKMKSVMLSAGTGAHTFRLGYQHSDGDSAFPYIALSNPYVANYIQILDFGRPDEKSWQARYDLDFATLGVPGLKGLVRYVSGDNIDIAGADKEWERDIDFTYTVQNGPLKNVSIQWRNAMVRSDVAGDIDENRLILNYTIALR